jgi:D-alanine-D-alanine ligase
VVGNEAYPLIEIRPKEGFYDYANKYTAGRTEYLCPAPVSERDTKAMQEMALKAFTALGCQGFGRVDFLYADDGRFICLEVNTLPGMTKNSLVPKAAKARGEQPPQLMQKIIEHSLRKTAVAP